MATDIALLSGPLTEAFEQVAQKRRSVYSYLADPVPRSVIDWAIGLAMLAPNHHKTRPWRFFVFADASLHRLAAAYADAAVRLGRDVERARKRAYDAPTMIVVVCIPAVSNSKVKVAEEEFATAAATQNLMLGLAAAGVGSLLTTGDLVESDELRAAIGLEGGSNRVMGVVNAGMRDPVRPLAPRSVPDVGGYTTWITA